MLSLYIGKRQKIFSSKWGCSLAQLREKSICIRPLFRRSHCAIGRGVRAEVKVVLPVPAIRGTLVKNPRPTAIVAERGPEFKRDRVTILDESAGEADVGAAFATEMHLPVADRRLTLQHAVGMPHRIAR